MVGFGRRSAFRNAVPEQRTETSNDSSLPAADYNDVRKASSERSAPFSKAMSLQEMPNADVKLVAQNNGRYTYQITPNEQNVKLYSTKRQHSLINAKDQRMVSLRNNEVAEYTVEVNGKFFYNKDGSLATIKIQGGKIYNSTEAEKKEEQPIKKEEAKPIAPKPEAEKKPILEPKIEIAPAPEIKPEVKPEVEKPIVESKPEVIKPKPAEEVKPVVEQKLTIRRKEEVKPEVETKPAAEVNKNDDGTLELKKEFNAKQYLTEKGYNRVLAYLERYPNIKVTEESVCNGDICIPFEKNIAKMSEREMIQSLRQSNPSFMSEVASEITSTFSIFNKKENSVDPAPIEEKATEAEQAQELLTKEREKLANGTVHHVRDQKAYDALLKEAKELGIPVVMKIGMDERRCAACRTYSPNFEAGAQKQMGKVLFISMDHSDAFARQKYNQLARGRGLPSTFTINADQINVDANGRVNAKENILEYRTIAQNKYDLTPMIEARFNVKNSPQNQRQIPEVKPSVDVKRKTTVEPVIKKDLSKTLKPEVISTPAIERQLQVENITQRSNYNNKSVTTETRYNRPLTEEDAKILHSVLPDDAKRNFSVEALKKLLSDHGRNQNTGINSISTSTYQSGYRFDIQASHNAKTNAISFTVSSAKKSGIGSNEVFRRMKATIEIKDSDVAKKEVNSMLLAL